MDPQSAHRTRPAFPQDAVGWLAGPDPRSVVVLGTADLAAAFAHADHDVAHPGPGAGPLPFPDRSVDVVVAARGVPSDLADVARVLRPGGQLALVWNERDHRIPWARKLDRLLGTEPAGDSPESPVVTSGRFGFVSDRAFTYWQVVNQDSLTALLRDELADRDPEDREERIAAALELYADYGRGMDGMQMPWVSRCFKATVVESAWASPRALDEPAAAGGTDRTGDGPDDGAATPGDRETRRSTVSEDTVPLAATRDAEPPRDGRDGSDSSDLLLIDFR
jgi:SAM-dependent methyltransferase